MTTHTVSASPDRQAHSQKLAGEIVRIHAGGFGFVRDSAGVDYFVHISTFPQRDRFQVGQSVRFRPEPNADAHRAPRAKDIELVDSSFVIEPLDGEDADA